MALYDRTRQFLGSRRVRLFILLSVGIHVIGFVTIATNKTVRDFFFARAEAPPLEVSDERIAEALRHLRIKYITHLLTVADLENSIREELNGIQERKMIRLQGLDTAPLPEGMPEEDRLLRLDPAHMPFPTIEPVDVPDIQSQLQQLADGQEPDITLAEAYDLCVRLERHIGHLYERYLALDLAEHPTQPIPVHQAIPVTRQKFSDRRPVQEERLQDAITTLNDGKFDAYKEEVVALYLESEDIRAACTRWIDFVRSKEKALQDGGMTMFGENVLLAQPPPVAYTGHIINKRHLKPTNLTSQIDFRDPAMKLRLGNQIGENDWAYQSNWLTLDRWYIIGPFEHPDAQGRSLAALSHKYPPESSNGLKIDLDAQYLGKRNQTLHWKYRHFDASFKEGIRIEPYSVDNMKHAIWYFFTQISCDQDMEIVASFASDDFGVCWINGQEVYNSGTGTQPFVPFNQTSFRVIQLKKGINRVLFKLENNTGSTGFGAFFMTYSDPELITAVNELNEE